MKRSARAAAGILLFSVLSLIPLPASAQVTRADYDRATGLRSKLQPLALNIVDRGGWIGKSSRYWYRKSVPGGNEYWIVDATQQRENDRLRPCQAGGGPGRGIGREGRGAQPAVLWIDVQRGREIRRVRGVRRPLVMRSGHVCRQKARDTRATGRHRPRHDHVGAGACRRSRFEGNESLARRQMGGLHPELQRLSPGEGQEGGGRPQPRRLGRELLHVRFPGLGARLEEARGPAAAPRLSPGHPLCRVVARGPAPAEALRNGVRQARRRSRHREAGPLSGRRQIGDRGRRRALPESLRADRPLLAQGQPGLHFRIQPARPPGLPDRRGRRDDGRGPSGGRRTSQDVLLLQREEISL